LYTIYFLGYLIETRTKDSKYSSHHLQKHWIRELLDIEIKMAGYYGASIAMRSWRLNIRTGSRWLPPLIHLAQLDS